MPEQQQQSITKEHIEALTLKNGFEVLGKSGVVKKENFSKEIGERFAYEDAFNKIWELEGYKLQWHLHYRV